MQQTLTHSVAWLAQDSFHKLNNVQSELSHHNFEAKINSSITGQEDIALLHMDCYSGMADLKKFYKTIIGPILIIVRTNEQEIEVFGFIKDGDDVCRDDAPLQLITARLNRILQSTGQIQLQNIQNLDPLTGLLSRLGIHDEFTRHIESDAPFSSGSWAFVYLDLDHFKCINDSYGHAVGDEILQEVARLLLEETGPEDRVGRLGGDEFVLLLSRYNTQTVMDSVERFRQRLAAHDFKCMSDHMTASIGVSILGPQSQLDESLRQADMAMYQAKDSGRNNLVCFDSMQDLGVAVEQDLQIQHFENVTRVVNERVTNLITLLGRRLIASARQEANHDALTQLHNRRYFDNRLSREFEMAKKHGRSITVAFMDIDKFHDVNTTFGWPTGDHVLKIFSTIASENIRLVDWLARYGGEEFCLVMLDTELDQGITIAERIRVAVADADVQSLDHRPVRLTVSIGVAKLTDDIESPVALMQKASKALNLAKTSGRNCLRYDH